LRIAGVLRHCTNEWWLSIDYEYGSKTPKRYWFRQTRDHVRMSTNDMKMSKQDLFPHLANTDAARRTRVESRRTRGRREVDSEFHAGQRHRLPVNMSRPAPPRE
jgi:hypothetical protein